MKMAEENRRTEHLNHLFVEACKNCFQDEADRLSDWYLHHEAKLLESFMGTIINGLSELHSYQEQGLKGSLTYLQLSFLMNGIYSGENLLKLDFYDTRYYKDPYDFDCFWDFSMLFPNTKQHRTQIQQYMKTHIPRLMEYEVNERMNTYRMEQFSIMNQIIRLVFQEDRIQQLIANENDQDIYVMFGTYLGEAGQVRKIAGRGGTK